MAYSIIPVIPSLQEPLKTSVRVAFAESIRIFWFVLIGVAGAGLASALFMEGLPLQTTTDERWRLQDDTSQTTRVELGRVQRRDTNEESGK